MSVEGRWKGEGRYSGKLRIDGLLLAMVNIGLRYMGWLIPTRNRHKLASHFRGLLHFKISYSF